MALLNAGGLEMGVLSKLLGHSELKTTQSIYADWVTESLRREYDTAQSAVRKRS
jgi:site-specific recombinase XerD